MKLTHLGMLTVHVHNCEAESAESSLSCLVRRQLFDSRSFEDESS